MKLAIQGCSHGELDAIYASVLRIEREASIQIDALLLCGDFQAIRNHSDLHTMAVPQKYLKLGEFHSYYSGEKVAPMLTIVIGGNHESSGYMHELYHGGWLAPNIYFLGAAGVVELNGLVIGGISGIWKGKDYQRGRFERLPYDDGTKRSCYHTREFDVVRLKAMQGGDKAVDMVMSHDWPNTIERWGDTKELIKKKPFFKEEIESKTLGSPPLMEVLRELKPQFWFSAHLHVRFAALYTHCQSQQAQEAAKAQTSAPAEASNPEALDIDLDFDEEEPLAPQDASTAPAVTDNATEGQIQPADKSAGKGTAEVPTTTRFLALHKCLSHSPFLQVIDHPSPFDSQLEAHKAARQYTQRIPPTFRYNKRWLAITRAYHPHFSTQYRQPPLPSPSDPAFLRKIEEEERWLDAHLSIPSSTKNGGKRKQDEPEGSRLPTPESHAEEEEEDKGSALDIHRVQQFVRTAPAPFEPGGLNQGPPAWYTNPQTEAFCRFIGVENKINPRPPAFAAPPQPGYNGFGAPPQYQPHPHQQQQLASEMAPKGTESESADPNALSIDMDDLDDVEGGDSHKAGELQQDAVGEEDTRDGLTTLSDDDELHARWKEGTG